MRTIRGKLVYETVEEIADPKHTALLVIDVQNDNASPRGCFASSVRGVSWIRRTALPNIKKVLAEARRLGVLVIFARATTAADGTAESGPMLRFMSRTIHSEGLTDYQVEGTWGNEVLEELAPRPNERQLIKYRSSAFIGTPLDMILRSHGIESAVVVGLVTQGCVQATVKDLFHYGYYPVVLSDGVASSRPKLHKAALLIMAHQGDVIPAAELLRIWRTASTNKK